MMRSEGGKLLRIIAGERFRVPKKAVKIFGMSMQKTRGGLQI